MNNTYEPIRLHPDNPHYFLFRGEPTILFTSGEHYAIVMDKHFDYVKYFDTLSALGFNHTRVYTGIKRERPGEHNIDGNSLAVLAEDFIGPWARTDVPGCGDGGNKYDLDRWDEAYFARFKDVLSEAGKRGIELEVILHGPLHLGGDGVGPWGICPLNARNNINGVGDVEFWEANSLKDAKLVEYQDRYTQKMVSELNAFDNLHFEICNEPYTGSTNGPTFDGLYDDDNMRLKWQQHVADVVYEAESSLPNRHLISCNYLAGIATISKPLEHVDLYCFHYTTKELVQRNYALNKAIGMNETGIMEPPDYPKQAWMCVLGGMALYNMLDYSFIPGHEDGTYQPLPSNPGYTGMSGEALRCELKLVNDFINGFDFVKMRPANELLVYDAGLNPDYQLLAEENEQYALFHIDTQHSGYGHHISIAVQAADGDYRVRFVNALSGEVERDEVRKGVGGVLKAFHRSPKAYAKNHSTRFAIAITRIH